jgi:ribonuclease Z
MYEAAIHSLEPGECISGDGYRIEAFETDHTCESIGFALIEEARPGRFDVGQARSLGIPEGPLFGKLHQGESVRLDDGQVVRPEELVGAPRPGRTIVYTGDTRPSAKTVEIATGGDLLVHDATFEASESDRARETGHSTAEEAAYVAAEAKVKQLVLTHISARYAEQPGRLLDEARATFPSTDMAKDGWSIEVPYQDSEDS